MHQAPRVYVCKRKRRGRIATVTGNIRSWTLVFLERRKTSRGESLLPSVWNTCGESGAVKTILTPWRGDCASSERR